MSGWPIADMHRGVAAQDSARQSNSALTCGKPGPAKPAAGQKTAAGSADGLSASVGHSGDRGVRERGTRAPRHEE